MSRFIIRLTLVMVLALTGANLTSRTLGTLRPLHAVMDGMHSSCEGEGMPCWYGITLGESTTREVEAIFTGFGDTIVDNATKGQLEIYRTTKGGCFAQFIYGRGTARIINEIILTNCARARLGDLLAEYGEPPSLGTGLSCESNRRRTQHNHYYIEYPTDGILASINRPAHLSPWLSLHGNIRQLYIVVPHEGDGRVTWEGMVSFWRFVRLHPEQINMTNCWP
ncbi:MAG: hypothetical protein LCI00_25110 [Chloroflexi bacterium]|nr:hypothetical protein [Chloroflexota bacterium]MCC6895734.1 hypothetical protein [Anaerolineae bacterium]